MEKRCRGCLKIFDVGALTDDYYCEECDTCDVEGESTDE